MSCLVLLVTVLVGESDFIVAVGSCLHLRFSLANFGLLFLQEHPLLRAQGIHFRLRQLHGPCGGDNALKQGSVCVGEHGSVQPQQLKHLVDGASVNP